MPGETPYCSPIDPFDESKGYECGAASLLADNARLQARVKDSIAVIDVAAAGAVRLKRERDRLQADVELALGMPLNERIDALVVSRDRYKALAERRGEDIRTMTNIAAERLAQFPADGYFRQLYDIGCAAIAATPEEEKERR